MGFRSYFRRLLRLGFGALLFSLPLEVCAQRSKPTPSPAPPQPVPLNLQVNRGETLTIPLRIYGTRAQRLDFLIRAKPQHGRLSAPKQSDQEVASVVYTPPDNLALKADRFAYAVRSREGVSAPAEVIIRIVDAAPRLIAPATIDFASLLVGETEAKTVELLNRGGGIAEGRLQVREPWKVKGPPSYRLAAGERQVFEVEFAPSAAGVFEAELQFTSDPTRETLLRGRAVAAVELVPGYLRLRQMRGEATRMGAFELRNHQSEAVHIELLGSDRLKLQRTWHVPPGEAVTVVVQTVAGDVAGLRERLTAQTNGAPVAALEIEAAAAGPLLQVKPAQLDFGEITAGQRATAVLQVANTGGTGVEITLEAPAPFALDRGKLNLAPGAVEPVNVSLTAVTSTSQQGEITIRAPDSERSVPLLARRAVSKAAGVPTRRREPRASRLIPVADTPPSERRSAVPFVPSQIVERTPRTATIAWSSKAAPGARFRAMARKLSLENGQLKINWVPYGDFEASESDGRILGTFRNLQPGQLMTFRIMAVAGGSERVLLERDVATPRPRKWGWRQWWLAGLIGALAICGGVAVWRRAQR